MAQILIAGCGYVGTALGLELSRMGNIPWGIRRDTSTLPPEIRLFQADLTVPGMLRNLPRCEFVVYAAGPSKREEKEYNAAYVEGSRILLQALQQQSQSPKRVFFLSSTAVYGQRLGEWIDESSPTIPPDFRGRVLLEAEGIFLGSPFPATVLRLGGIYGPERAPWIQGLKAGTVHRSAPNGAIHNRIHRDDIVGILLHLMELPSPPSICLGVDSEPTDSATVLSWLARSMGLPEPPVMAEDPAAEEGEGGGKRCRNDLVLRLGYRFEYPTFREGYGAILREDTLPV